MIYYRTPFSGHFNPNMKEMTSFVGQAFRLGFPCIGLMGVLGAGGLEKLKIPDFKVSTHEFFCENAHKWAADEGYFYELNKKWIELKKIRDVCNVSIETKRASKEIGSSLEASLKINLDKNLNEISKNVDFSELCITSSAEVSYLKNSSTLLISFGIQKTTT